MPCLPFALSALHNVTFEKRDKEQVGSIGIDLKPHRNFVRHLCCHRRNLKTQLLSDVFAVCTVCVVP